MLNQNLRDNLQRMQTRVRGLHQLAGVYAPEEATRLDAFFDDLLTPKGDDGKALAGDALKARLKQQCQFVIDAYSDPEKMRQLCGIRLETENNYIRVTSNFAEMFYDVVTLKDDERPAVQNETMQEIDVGYVSQDGRTRLTKALAQQAELLLPLRVLSTDEFGYFTRDIYNGDLRPAAERTIDLAFDARNKYDQNAYTLMVANRNAGGCFGAFDTTNATRVSRDYVVNSRAVTANFPTTNDILVTGNTAFLTANPLSSGFRLDVCRQILNYCNSWGGNTFKDGPLRPTGIIMVPSADVTSLAYEIKPTGATNNPVANALMQDYMMFTYMNVNWVLVPDATLTPGKCYAVLNKKVGKLFLKPSQDQEVVKLTEKNGEDYETRKMKKVVGYYIPSNRRIHALRLDYLSAS